MKELNFLVEYVISKQVHKEPAHEGTQTFVGYLTNQVQELI